MDMDELAAAFTPKTRALVINTPHNPTGKVFTREELTAISEIVRGQGGAQRGCGAALGDPTFFGAFPCRFLRTSGWW